MNALRNVSEPLNYIFIHPRKTGGKSIERAMFGREPVPGSAGHATASDVRLALGKSKFDQMFSFGFLRNPWDRVVSIYHGRQQILHRRMPPFDEFVRGFGPENQMDHFTHWGRVIVTAILSFERMAEGWAAVQSALKMDIDLPHENASEHRPYREYYTAETRQIIAERCAVDIEYGGYEF